jgi:hypothetical protein
MMVRQMDVSWADWMGLRESREEVKKIWRAVMIVDGGVW